MACLSRDALEIVVATGLVRDVCRTRFGVRRVVEGGDAYDDERLAFGLAAAEQLHTARAVEELLYAAAVEAVRGHRVGPDASCYFPGTTQNFHERVLTQMEQLQRLVAFSTSTSTVSRTTPQ